METCKPFKSMEEMGEIVDNYGYNSIFDEEIEHHRTTAIKKINE